MRATLLLLLCLHYTRLVQGAATGDSLPRVTWTPGTRVRAGDTVMLECQVGGMGDEPAIWLRLNPDQPNSDEIISHGDLVIMEDTRLTVAHHPSTNSFVLAIRGVSERDAGRYQCRVPVSSEGADLREAPPITISVQDDGELPENSSGSRSLWSAPSLVCFTIPILLHLKHLVHR